MHIGKPTTIVTPLFDVYQFPKFPPSFCELTYGLLANVLKKWLHRNATIKLSCMYVNLQCL